MSAAAADPLAALRVVGRGLKGKATSRPARIAAAEAGLALLARIVVRSDGRHGALLFERLEREIAAMRAESDLVARARALAQQAHHGTGA